MLGDHAAILAYAFQVRAGFLVARLGQFRQAEDGDFAAFERQDALARVNADAEFLRFERLADEVVGAGVQALDDVLRSPPRGQQNDVDVAAGISLANVPAQFDSGHPRHFPVENHQAIRAAPHQFQGLEAVSGRGHLVPDLRKRICQDVRGDVVIIDDQDAHDVGSDVACNAILGRHSVLSRGAIRR